MGMSFVCCIFLFFPGQGRQEKRGQSECRQQKRRQEPGHEVPAKWEQKCQLFQKSLQHFLKASFYTGIYYFIRRIELVNIIQLLIPPPPNQLAPRRRLSTPHPPERPPAAVWRWKHFCLHLLVTSGRGRSRLVASIVIAAEL